MIHAGACPRSPRATPHGTAQHALDIKFAPSRYQSKSDPRCSVASILRLDAAIASTNVPHTHDDCQNEPHRFCLILSIPSSPFPHFIALLSTQSQQHATYIPTVMFPLLHSSPPPSFSSSPYPSRRSSRSLYNELRDGGCVRVINRPSSSREDQQSICASTECGTMRAR